MDILSLTHKHGGVHSVIDTDMEEEEEEEEEERFFKADAVNGGHSVIDA